MAGRIHGQTAARAQGPARAQHGLRLLGEGDDLLGAQPEADAWGVVAGALLAGCALARDEDEHAPIFVVPEPHLADLPLRLAGLKARIRSGGGDPLDALVRDHLLEPDYERLDLRFLAAERQRPPGTARKQEELAPAAATAMCSVGSSSKMGIYKSLAGRGFDAQGMGNKKRS
jgi:hypothetical protein